MFAQICVLFTVVFYNFYLQIYRLKNFQKSFPTVIYIYFKLQIVTFFRYIYPQSANLSRSACFGKGYKPVTNGFGSVTDLKLQYQLVKNSLMRAAQPPEIS